MIRTFQNTATKIPAKANNAFRARTLYEVDRSTGRLFLNLHEGQARAWNSDRRFVFVLAGTQGGKTSFGVWWLWREINRLGSGDYLAVTASYDLFKLKMLPTIREVFENTFGIARYWSGDRILEIADPERGFLAKRRDDPMYARIILRSAESGSGLESATARAAWVDEAGQDAFTLETWEAILRRLSLSEGRVLATTTLYNAGWIKSEIYDSWLSGDKDVEIIQFDSTLNPNFSKKEFERARGKMQDWRFRMFYKGEFAKPAGLIYSGFDSESQVLEDFAIPSHYPRYVGLDFGAVNTAKIWIAFDPYKKIYIAYREELSGDKDTKTHVREANAVAKGENIIAYFGGSPSEDQQRRDWTSAGIRVNRPNVADVEGGIDRVAGLINSKRFFVFRSCRGILDELGTYKRKLSKSGDVLDEIENKRTFHRLDAIRYAIAGIVESDSGSFVIKAL